MDDSWWNGWKHRQARCHHSCVVHPPESINFFTSSIPLFTARAPSYWYGLLKNESSYYRNNESNGREGRVGTVIDVFFMKMTLAFIITHFALLKDLGFLQTMFIEDLLDKAWSETYMDNTISSQLNPFTAPSRNMEWVHLAITVWISQ